MTLFDLLFLLAALASLLTLAVLVISLLRRRWARARAILLIFAASAAAYLAFGLGVSFFSPQRILAVGDSWCFDDWCLAAQKFDRTDSGATASYKVQLRLFSEARGVTQRANGAWIFLMDEKGRRYLPAADPSAVPLDVQLRPQESALTTRVFQVPSDVRQLGLITGHGGAYCGAMDILIIGQSGCLFHKPTMIRIL